MSLKLANRLDQIESDIRLMLMLQKCESISRPSPSSSVDSNLDISNLPDKTHRDQRHNINVFTARVLTPIEVQKNHSRPIDELSQPANQCVEKTSKQDFNYQSSSDTMFQDVKPHCKQCYFSQGLELEYEYAKRRKLEEEVHQLKSDLVSIQQSKCIAVTMTTQLKKKNEKMKLSLEELRNTLLHITKEKDFLCKCLEREKMKSGIVPVVPFDVNTSTPFVNSIRGLETIEEHDEELKYLHESILMLSNQLQEKEKAKQNIISQKERVEQKLKKQKDISRKLSEFNEKLSNSIKNRHDSFMILRNKSNRYQKDMEQYQSKWDKAQLEIEKLRQELQNERIKSQTAEKKSLYEFSEELRKASDREKCALEAMQILNQRIYDIEDKVNNEAQKEIDILNAQIARMQIEVEDLRYNLRKYEEEDARSKAVKREDKACITIPPLLQAETQELLRHVEEQKRKIEELDFLKQQQDVVIKSQNEQLLSKEEQLRLQEHENAIIKDECLELDKQVETLRKTLDAKEVSAEIDNKNRDKINELESKVMELSSSLEVEKQKVYEQEKLVQKRNTELETMKKSANALEISKQKLEMALRQLTREKQAAKLIADGLEKINIRKAKLEDMMVDLEGTCKVLVGEKEQYMKMCTELEEELGVEKTNRLQERQILVDERNKAFEVAKLAAMTLIETVDDYEVLTRSQLETKRVVKDKLQKRRPGCPPVPLLKSKEETTSKDDKRQHEESFDTTFTSSNPVIDSIDTELTDDPSTSEPGGTVQSTFGTEGSDADKIRVAVAVPDISPYAVQTALISATPYACRVRNYGYSENQSICNKRNTCAIPSPSTSNKYKCGESRSTLQYKYAKIHAPITVTSKKNICAYSRKKRSK